MKRWRSIDHLIKDAAQGPDVTWAADLGTGHKKRSDFILNCIPSGENSLLPPVQMKNQRSAPMLKRHFEDTYLNGLGAHIIDRANLHIPTSQQRA